MLPLLKSLALPPQVSLSVSEVNNNQRIVSDGNLTIAKTFSIILFYLRPNFALRRPFHFHSVAAEPTADFFLVQAARQKRL
jgi:hypothetical protein